MKVVKLILFAGLMIAYPFSVGMAAQSKAKAKAKPKAAKTDQLQTNINFNDHGVFGEYQIPAEALANVEGEKGLNNLLGVRANFKDRLQEASEQE